MDSPNKKTEKFLCVDDFGVKYFGKDDTDHILNAHKNYYAILTYLEGFIYLGLTIDLESQQKLCVYIDARLCDKAIDQIQHNKTELLYTIYSLHRCTTPAHGKRLHMKSDAD